MALLWGGRSDLGDSTSLNSLSGLTGFSSINQANLAFVLYFGRLNSKNSRGFDFRFFHLNVGLKFITALNFIFENILSRSILVLRHISRLKFESFLIYICRGKHYNFRVGAV